MSSPLSPGKHTVTLNSLKINYLVVADAPDLPVILIHPPPWGVGAEFYIKAFPPRLSSKYTVVIPSPRGNDDSERPCNPNDMSSKHICADLDALREHLGLEKFPLVVGHSAGGIIALGYAIMCPSRVDKIALLCTALLGAQAKNNSFIDTLRAKFIAQKPETDEEFKSFISSALPGYFYAPGSLDMAAFIDSWHTTPRMWAYGAYYGADQAKQTDGVMPAEKTPAWSHVDELHKVTAKTLVLAGKQDPACPPDLSEKIAQGVKDVKLVVLDECGHFPWIEQEESFWREFAGFLEL
jgi:proline iminopeptidase